MASKYIAFDTAGTVYVANLGSNSGVLIPTLVNLKTSNGDVLISDMLLVNEVRTIDQAGHQVTQTLGDISYLWTFPDPPTQINLDGLAFLAPTCNTRSGSKQQSGFEQLYSFYLKNKISNLSRGPVQINLTIAGQPFRGFLVGLETRTRNDKMPATMFSMAIRALPAINKTR